MKPIKPYVISLTQAKTFLGVSDASYDTQINTYIPIVSDDLTRTNGICNQDFLIEGVADTDGTVTLSNVSLTEAEWEYLYVGSIVRINGEDGEIEDYDVEGETITLTSALTKTATEETLEVRNFPYGSKTIVSQMILYKINQGSISGATFGQEVKSKSIGTVRVQYAQSDTIDGYGYPTTLTKNLRTITKPRFC